MNNIQQTRIQLEKTYVSMGGNSLEQDAAQPLNELQSHLNVVLDELAHVFAVRLVLVLVSTLCLILLCTPLKVRFYVKIYLLKSVVLHPGQNQQICYWRSGL